MKAVSAIVLIGSICACASREDFVSPAKKCAQQHMKGASKIDMWLRKVVASKCASQIESWAMKSFEQRLGHPVDLRDARTREEYADSEQAILRLLVPLPSDPLRM